MPKEPTDSRNRITNGRWPKGFSGNPAGRPLGSRNKSTLLYEELLQSKGEELVKKVMERALQGDPLALRLCLDRLFPAPKERRIHLPLPRITNAREAFSAIADVVAAIGEGQITPGEGVLVSEIIGACDRLITAERAEQAQEQLEQEAAEMETELNGVLGPVAPVREPNQASPGGPRRGPEVH